MLETKNLAVRQKYLWLLVCLQNIFFSVCFAYINSIFFSFCIGELYQTFR